MRTVLIASSLLCATLLIGATTDVETVPLPGVTPSAGPSNGVVPGILDQTWWKLTVTAKGSQVDPKDGTVSPASLKFTAYMFLVADTEAAEGGGSGTGLYDYDLWVETADDQWTQTVDGSSFFVDGLDKKGQHAFATSNFFLFDLDPEVIAGVFTSKFTIKTDTQGVLKSAKLKPSSGTLSGSSLSGQSLTNGLHGSLKVSGTTVDVEDLPFLLF